MSGRLSTASPARHARMMGQGSSTMELTDDVHTRLLAHDHFGLGCTPVSVDGIASNGSGSASRPVAHQAVRPVPAALATYAHIDTKSLRPVTFKLSGRRLCRDNELEVWPRLCRWRGSRSLSKEGRPKRAIGLGPGAARREEGKARGEARGGSCGSDRAERRGGGGGGGRRP